MMRMPMGGLQPRMPMEVRGTAPSGLPERSPRGCGYLLLLPGARGRRVLCPVKVNAAPQSAMALGTIRGAHLAVEPEG